MLLLDEHYTVAISFTYIMTHNTSNKSPRNWYSSYWAASYCNYFGVMKQIVELQHKGYENRIFIADYHSLVKCARRRHSFEVYSRPCDNYLAIGVNPELVTIYKQSDVPSNGTHLDFQLYYYYAVSYACSCIQRCRGKRTKEINVAKFEYPLLMAADISYTQCRNSSSW